MDRWRWMLLLVLSGCGTPPGAAPPPKGLSDFPYPPTEERVIRETVVLRDGAWIKVFEPRYWVWEEGWVYYPVPADGWVFVWGTGWVALGPVQGPPQGNPGLPPNDGLPPSVGLVPDGGGR